MSCEGTVYGSSGVTDCGCRDRRNAAHLLLPSEVAALVPDMDRKTVERAVAACLLAINNRRAGIRHCPLFVAEVCDHCGYRLGRHLVPDNRCPTPGAASNFLSAAYEIDFHAIKERMEYNSHDLGEFGKVVRLEYVCNILDDAARRLRTDLT